MKNSILLVTVFTMFMFSCSEEVKTTVVEVDALSASDIYSVDSVLKFLQRVDQKNIELSESYHKRSVESKETNLEKAIYFEKRAITLYPKLDYYQSLADLLYLKSSFKERQTLYSFLVYPSYQQDADKFVFDKPTIDFYYEYIVSSILAFNNFYPEVLYEASEMGYNTQEFKERLLKEERIKLDKQSAEFQEIMIQFLSYDELKKYTENVSVFNSFIASLPDSSAAFEIDEKTIQEFNYRSSEDYEEDMMVHLTSVYVYYTYEKHTYPDSWFSYNMLRGFKASPTINIIEYAVDSSETACPKDMRHIYHRIVTYDNNAKMIDSKVIAYQDGEKLALVNSDGRTFRITEYSRKFRTKYDRSNFDNELMSTEKVGSKVYQINTDGKIVESVI